MVHGAQCMLDVGWSMVAGVLIHLCHLVNLTKDSVACVAVIEVSENNLKRLIH